VGNRKTEIPRSRNITNGNKPTFEIISSELGGACTGLISSNAVTSISENLFGGNIHFWENTYFQKISGHFSVKKLSRPPHGMNYHCLTLTSSAMVGMSRDVFTK